MIVYVVTTRIGDSRKIEAVFDEHKQAAYYCAVKNDGDVFIEEWDTDAIKFTGSKELLCRWGADFDQNGSVLDLWSAYTLEERHTCSEEVDGSTYVCETLAYGTPEEEAKRILRDRFAEYRSRKAK